eukprot:Lankesteria_metandrocarpae@DN506_c0_g1_i1.p1
MATAMTTTTSNSTPSTPLDDLSNAGVLGDAERNELSRTVDARQKLIEEKKEALAKLKRQAEKRAAAGGGGTATAAAGGGAGEALTSANLLNSLLETVTIAAKEVLDGTTQVPLSATGATAAGAAGTTVTTSTAAAADGSLQQQQDLSKKLRAVFGEALAVSTQPNVNILPLGMDTFEKGSQADFDPVATGGVPSILDPLLDPSALQSNAKESSSTADSSRGGNVLPPPPAIPKLDVDGSDPHKSVGPGGVLLTPPAPTGTAHTAKPGDTAIPVNLDPLSEEEKSKILASSSFKEFFDSTTKLVERSLGRTEMFDVLADYSGWQDASAGAAAEEDTVKSLHVFKSEKYSADRPVTSMRCSPIHQDLFMCSYGCKRNPAITDSEGTVLVWSMQMTKRPEYVFTCQSAICSALWDPFQPHVLIGGSYTGSIIVWDTRAKSRPVQRSPLSPKSHMHPIYSMEIVGSQHAHNLVSVDADGRLCLWSLNMLVLPSETIDLKKGSKESSTAAVLAVSFPDGETNTLVGGAQDGSIFQAQIHGSKVGVTDTYNEGHSGPVTSVDWHRGGDAQQGSDFSELLLSSSVDWTVKLWSPKHHSTPLHSFEINEDYVFDAKWHPNHPGVFATGDAMGTLDFWDISRDMEIPVVRTDTTFPAINKVLWSSDGKRILAGSTEGDVGVWMISQDLCTVKADDDWRMRLEEKIEDFKQSQDPSSGAGSKLADF